MIQSTLQHITTRTHFWISRHAECLQGVQALQLLAAARLCEWLNPLPPSAQQPPIRQLLSCRPERHFAETDLITALTASDLIMQHGSPEQRQLALDYRAALLELLPEMAGNRVLLESILLPVDDTPLDNFQLHIPYYARNRQLLVSQTLQALEHGSRYGRIALHTSALTTRKIEAMSLNAQRQYDIALAARSLRCRAYLSREMNLATETSLHWLRHQQSADGSFGDYASSLAGLDRAERDSVRIQIQLALTLQILWALHDLQPDTVTLVTRLHQNHMDSQPQQQVAAC